MPIVVAVAEINVVENFSKEYVAGLALIFVLVVVVVIVEDVQLVAIVGW